MPGWEQTDRVHKDVMYDVTSIPGKTPWSRWGSGCEIVAVRAAALTLTDGLKATCKQGTQVITLFLQARHAGDHLIFASKARRLSPYFCKQGTQVITLFLQARHAGYHLIFASKARRLSPTLTLFWGCTHYFEDVHIDVEDAHILQARHTGDHLYFHLPWHYFEDVPLKTK